MNITGETKHSFICADTMLKKILWIDEQGKITNEIQDVGDVFDIWNLPDGRLLYSHTAGNAGFTILNKDLSVAMQWNTEHETFSCQPLENGNVMVGLLGVNKILEIDLKGKTVNEIAVPYDGIPHESMRMVRKVGNEYYVVQPGRNRICKFSEQGKNVGEYTIRHDAFGMVAKPNGNIVYTCMEGAFELDKDGREIRSFTNEDAPWLNICWLLGIQMLSNGNFVFTNWMGHGHLDEGVHFFEVNREKEVVWSCDGRGALKMPSVLQIIEENPYDVCYRPLK